ncbi:DUF4870 domain-containing protein [Demequina sp. SO4-13]|uniref:DUF4870 domain-containing protein n=1 Tax=Demequina sp. SO4-13 TaxID=3401027 RepID=UPI003AF9234A
MTDSTTPPPPEQPYNNGQPTGGQPASSPPMSDSEGRTYATIAHAGVAASAFLGITLLAPLVIWLIAKERSAFVDKEAKEALNFSILLVILYFVGGILAFVLIGFLVLAAAWICSIIFGVMGAIAANKGQNYRYPVNLRLVK